MCEGKERKRKRERKRERESSTCVNVEKLQLATG
jgi:hypothetical protein